MWLVTLLTGKSALAGNFIDGRGGLGGFFGRGAVRYSGYQGNSTVVIVFKQGDIWQVNQTETGDFSVLEEGF